jgi:hypothetical protein
MEARFKISPTAIFTLIKAYPTIPYHIQADIILRASSFNNVGYLEKIKPSKILFAEAKQEFGILLQRTWRPTAKYLRQGRRQNV